MRIGTQRYHVLFTRMQRQDAFKFGAPLEVSQVNNIGLEKLGEHRKLNTSLDTHTRIFTFIAEQHLSHPPNGVSGAKTGIIPGFHVVQRKCVFSQMISELFKHVPLLCISSPSPDPPFISPHLLCNIH